MANPSRPSTKTSRDAAKSKKRPQQAWHRTLFKKGRSWLEDQTRLKPRFIIIGAQRCGTTSLYNYLGEHPLIAPAEAKEVHFFDIEFEKGWHWYRQRFPSRLDPAFAERERGRLITGEASPYYIFHPLVPRRLAAALPDVKLLAILRNPVDRAISQYHHEIRQGTETLSFEDAIAAEETRLKGERERILGDPTYHSLSYQSHSYRARGCYMDQLDEWLKFFPRQNLLVLLSETFYADPSATLRRVTDFLGLPELPPRGASAFEKHNYADYAEMSPELRRELVEFYRPHNQRLAQFLGMELPWDR
jgi:hypothetical protein